MTKSLVLLLVLAIAGVDAGAADAQSRAGRAHPPRRIGQCALTTISAVGTRLVGENNRPVPESGSAVELANGVYGVSYDRVRAIRRSRVGDRVRTCLVSIPRSCPPGDDRGREYRTTNLRTRQSWTLPDSQHSCGGA